MQNFRPQALKGAVFTLKLDGGKPSGFTWTSDARWVSVTDGVVEFTGIGTGDKVTITGTPTSGQGNPITFSFTLNLWLTDMQIATSYVTAVGVCSNRGLKLPSASDVSNVTSSSGISTRSRGNAYGEWGNFDAYSPDWQQIYWTSIAGPEGGHKKIFLGDNYPGFLSNSGKESSDTGPINTACIQVL